MAKRGKKQAARKRQRRPLVRPPVIGTTASAVGALACGGAVFAYGALFAGPAADFLRAINGVPWTSWDGGVALGLGVLLLVGLLAMSLSVLGGIFVDRLKSGVAGTA